MSQDPIGLASGELGFYNYVDDCNNELDVLGLKKTYSDPKKLSLTEEGKHHVIDRHWGSHPDWSHKSKWVGNRAEWKTKSRKTFKNPDRISRDGNRYIYEKEFKKPIGKDALGNDLFKSRVVTEANGDLVTSFPQADWK
ncbi:hypothetical protein [Flavobacterium sp. 140616W15]|uniref:hypothetical protein n=1 Tax=Flavobacterium sp. 140616W15 TaxID=2478552 RepID=UPI001F5C7DEB|nr:hypothetical protein [Flavobacterium sp. 140616W15]